MLDHDTASPKAPSHAGACAPGAARAQPQQVGFTLIELMITVAVIAILLAVAYPSYESYIRRANRAAAQAVLQDVAARQQQNLLDTRLYVAGTDPAATGAVIPSKVTSTYTVSMVVSNAAGTPPTFTLTATPIGRQALDTECGTMTLNQAGVKTKTGPKADCW